ncbi:hypothetical protein Tco_0818575 [Tanacetum coccineum]
MADNRTMAQMLQAPIEGYEDAIVVPPINANNFELKQPLINLVQSNKFTGRQDPHNHLRFFNKVTSTFRHPEVPNTSIKLLLFPFSLDGEARDWLDKEPPRSILTWDGPYPYALYYNGQYVSKTDFENYVKANDAVLKNVQNQGQNLQNQMANVTSLLTNLCNNFKDSASTSNSGTLPSQTVTNPRQQINAITTRSVPEKLEDPGKFLIPCALQELNRTSALADFGASINLLPHSIYKKLGIEALTPTRRPFLRTAKALIDLYEETLTLRVGKEELVYYADKSEKNKEKNFVHAISIIDFSKDDPFSGSTTNTLPPSSSPVKTSDNFEKFADELAPLNSLPPGNDVSIHKKDFHEETFRIYSNPLFEFDDNFKSSNVNPLFEENDKDVEIKSSSSFTLTSPEESEFEAYLERDSIPPGIDLTLPPTLEVSSSNPTSPTLTGEKVCSWKTPMFFSLVRFVWKMMTRSSAIRKKINCLLETYLHQKPKPLSQKVEEIKEKEDAVSSDFPIHAIVMPIRITFENPLDFNESFS